jgi:hypothetical protein
MKESSHLSFKNISTIDKGATSSKATLHTSDNIKWLVTKTNRRLLKNRKEEAKESREREKDTGEEKVKN